MSSCRVKSRICVCEVCGNTFHPWQGLSRAKRYCSLHDIGGFIKHEKGYRIRLIKKSAGGSGYMPLSRLIVQSILQRFLKSWEIVHHINGNCYDNRLCNLLVCIEPYHRWLHNTRRILPNDGKIHWR